MFSISRRPGTKPMPPFPRDPPATSIWSGPRGIRGAYADPNDTFGKITVRLSPPGTRVRAKRLSFAFCFIFRGFIKKKNYYLFATPCHVRVCCTPGVPGNDGLDKCRIHTFVFFVLRSYLGRWVWNVYLVNLKIIRLKQKINNLKKKIFFCALTIFVWGLRIAFP